MKSWLVTLLLLVALPVEAQEAFPPGEDFQVNTYTTGSQRNSSVAADAQGNFVVVWDSTGSSGTDINEYSIQGQRFDASGNPLGEQFQVNSYWPDKQKQPAVAADPEGNFVVAWQSWGSYFTDTSQYSIQAQRFDSTGTPVGGEFQVNTYWTNSQANPSLVVDAQGNFLVVWASGGSSAGVFGQRFDASGTPVGTEFQVNSYLTGGHGSPSVASDAEGNFIVAWWASGSPGNDPLSSIQAQRFNSDAVLVGEQFQVNSFTGGYQEHPVAAMGPQGNFVVVWHSAGSYDLDTKDTIRAKVFDTDANPLGGFFSEFQVNSYGTGAQFRPAVASDVQGNFVVSWDSEGSYGTDTYGPSIQGQRIAADRSFLDGEFQVNSYTTKKQAFPAITVGPGGQFVVVWASAGSSGSDTDGYSIQARRFDMGVFVDGFESGDTSAWSGSVP